MSIAEFHVRSSRTKGGSSALAYDQDGVKVWLGDWIVVEIDNVLFEFNRGDFDWTFDMLMGPDRPGAGTVVNQVVSKLVEVGDRELFSSFIDALAKVRRESYREGLEHGKRATQEQIREALGL